MSTLVYLFTSNKISFLVFLLNVEFIKQRKPKYIFYVRVGVGEDLERFYGGQKPLSALKPKY